MKKENKKIVDDVDELDNTESDEELDRVLEKYANLEKQHEQWNREDHDLEKSQEIADKFAEEMGLRSIIIEEKNKIGGSMSDINDKKEKKEVDWDKVMKNSKDLLEKYANLEKQHEQWNRENHDLEKSQEIADKFAEEMGLRSITIEEKTILGGNNGR